MCGDAIPDAVLEEGPRSQQHRHHRLVRLAEQVTADPEVQLGQIVDAGRTRRDELVHQTGEQLVGDLDTARLESMYVPALGHPAPTPGAGRERIPLDHRHSCKSFAEHSRRQQTADAGAEHYGVFVRHVVFPPTGRAAIAAPFITDSPVPAHGA
jgi:hypothetical protein